MKNRFFITIVVILLLSLFNIDKVMAQEDNEKVFEGLEQNFIDIKVICSSDNNDEVIKEGKGIFIPNKESIKYVLVDKDVLDYKQAEGKNYEVQAELENGVSVSLTEEFVSEKLGIEVMALSKEIKSNAELKFMSGEENISVNSDIYVYTESGWSNYGKVNKYYEKDSIQYMMINPQNSKIELKKGDALLNEKGICVGIATEEENVVLSILSLTNTFDQFSMSYTGCTNVQTDELDKILEQAEEIKLSDYTQSSAEKFSSVLDEAKKCRENESSTQEEIDENVKNVESAENGLVKDEHIKMYIIIGLIVVNIILAIVIFAITRKKKNNKKTKQDERSERLKVIDEDLRKEEIKEDGIFEINDFKNIIKEEKIDNKDDYTNVLN